MLSCRFGLNTGSQSLTSLQLLLSTILISNQLYPRKTKSFLVIQILHATPA
jgi:hypothetical protein